MQGQTRWQRKQSGASACYTNCTSVEDYDHDDEMKEPADTFDLGRDDGEEAPDDDDENDTFSPYVAVDDVIFFGGS